jgi:hypothetical protein
VTVAAELSSNTLTEIFIEGWPNENPSASFSGKQPNRPLADPASPGSGSGAAPDYCSRRTGWKSPKAPKAACGMEAGGLSGSGSNNPAMTFLTRLAELSSRTGERTGWFRHPIQRAARYRTVENFASEWSAIRKQSWCWNLQSLRLPASPRRSPPTKPSPQTVKYRPHS